jgi:hypothetical protein
MARSTTALACCRDAALREHRKPSLESTRASATLLSDHQRKSLFQELQGSPDAAVSFLCADSALVYS